MKKIAIPYFFTTVLILYTGILFSGFASVEVTHTIPPETEEKINAFVEKFEKKGDEWVEIMKETADQVTKEIKEALGKTDNNVNALLGHLSPEQLSRIVTQAGIALVASSTTVLSSYVLYIILRNEIQNSYLKNEKPSKKMIALAALNMLCLTGSITVLLYSSKIAQMYALPLI